MLNNDNYKVLNLPFIIKNINEDTKNLILKKFSKNEENVQIKLKNLNLNYKKEKNINNQFLIKKKIFKNKKTGIIKETYDIINEFSNYDFSNLQDFLNLENINFENYFKEIFQNQNINDIHSLLKLNNFSRDYTNYVSYTDISKYFINNIEFKENIRKSKNNIFFKKFFFKDIIITENIDFEINNKTEKIILEAFQEKKIWIKSSLTKFLQNKEISSIYQIKKAISKFCYVFSNGPFKYCYILKGYDPRKDSKNKFYQTFKISLNILDKNNKFIKNTITYQICEIKNLEIQKIVNNYKNEICNEKYGYFSKELWRFIKKTIKCNEQLS